MSKAGRGVAKEMSVLKKQAINTKKEALDFLLTIVDKKSNYKLSGK